MAMPTSTSGRSLSEDDKNVYIKAHLPGLDPKNIDVTMHEGYQWIRDEHAEDEEDKKRKFYRHAASSFSYRVAVFSDIDMNVKPEVTY
jgi:HSP20 family protein